MSPTFPTVKTWTRDEYYAAGSAGAFDGQRVELINGEILVTSPMSSRHAATIALMQEVFGSLLFPAMHPRVQLPINLESLSEPEPDLCVVSGKPRDFSERHPSSADLVVEVSDSSLDFDRSVKLALYASNGIPEYWIVNLRDNQLEVYRQPHGDAYGDVQHLDRTAEASPLFQPERPVTVADLLP